MPEALCTYSCQQDASFGPDFGLLEMAPINGRIKSASKERTIKVGVLVIRLSLLVFLYLPQRGNLRPEQYEATVAAATICPVPIVEDPRLTKWWTPELPPLGASGDALWRGRHHREAT